MFGDLLQPIGGLCIWRAFGHPGDTDDAKDWGEDQAMYQFKLWAPVDGKLHPNVALQIKNGALQRAARSTGSSILAAKSSDAAITTPRTSAVTVTAAATASSAWTFPVPPWRPWHVVHA